MRIVVLAIGTQGDVRPFVALGRGLKREGHAVVIATSQTFRELVHANGLEWSHLSSDFRQRMAAEGDTMRRAANPVIVAGAARRCLNDMCASWAKEGLAACENANLIVGSGMVTRLAMTLSEATGTPYVKAQLLPMTPAMDVPTLAFPSMPIAGPINLALHHALTIAAWRVLAPATNKVRKELGLCPLPWHGRVAEPVYARGRVLYGYSAQVVPRSRAWPADIRVSGYWFLDEGQDWTPEPALRAFLSAGPPPIYVGFSSLLGHETKKITADVVRAIAMSGQRAILATGWGGLAGDLSISGDRIMIIDEAPHDWLFPRVSLAVHHGGAGTTAAAVRAGIPSVVVPFCNDQPFWAWQLERLGVAPRAVHADRLTASSLLAAITEAMSASMRVRARSLGEAVAAEDGVGTAVQTLGGWGLLTSPRTGDVGASLQSERERCPTS